MRAQVFGTIVMLASAAALAQQPASQAPAPAPKLFGGSADVTSMIAKAKAERKPDQPNFVQPILQLAPYNANLEYRAAGVNAPASVHEREAEMFYVVELTRDPITRAVRKKVVAAVERMAASLPSLSRVERNEILRRAVHG